MAGGGAFGFEQPWSGNLSLRLDLRGEAVQRRQRMGAEPETIIDESYEPMDSFINDKANAERITVKHVKHGLHTLLDMLSLGRFDAALYDENVVANQVAAHHFDMSRVKNAGCLGDTPLFTAFNPKLSWAKDIVKSWMRISKNLRKKPSIKNILRRM